MYQTNMYEGMLAETIAITSTNGDVINAYFAQPLRALVSTQVCAEVTTLEKR